MHVKCYPLLATPVVIELNLANLARLASPEILHVISIVLILKFQWEKGFLTCIELSTFLEMADWEALHSSCVVNKHLCLVHVKPFYFDEAFNLIIRVHVNLAIIVRKAKNLHTGVQRAVLWFFISFFVLYKEAKAEKAHEPRQHPFSREVQVNRVRFLVISG